MDKLTTELIKISERVEREQGTKPRYFALVIRVPGPECQDQLGGVLSASTALWNKLRDITKELPAGSRITRSIELTEEFATKTWV